MRPQHIQRAAAFGTLIVCLLFLARDTNAQRTTVTHQIFMSVIEPKGSTTTLAPPAVNPTTLSKGYGYKGPGEADKNDPQRWEVASYNFLPAYIAVQQGDTVALVTFVVNGDQHQVGVLAPDGQVVVPTATWQRGREYRVSFVAEKVGTYRLTCLTHAPTMTANILVMPR